MRLSLWNILNHRRAKKQRKQIEQSGITKWNFSILEKKAHQNGVISGASNALAKISDVECVGLFGPGQATWSSEHGIRQCKHIIKVSSQVFQSTRKYFSEIKPRMQARDISLKTPLEFQTPSCCNGIGNIWKLLSAWWMEHFTRVDVLKLHYAIIDSCTNRIQLQ